MKHRGIITTLLTALLLLCALPAMAQLAVLRYDAGQVPVGHVFHFVKSHRDGSHPARISVYLPAADRIESLKWDEGGEQATLVEAQMDWARFSVRHFQGWRLVRGAAPERRVTLDVVGDQLSMSLMTSPLTVTHWPWHSYDFDFTSLNLVLPHLLEPQGSFSFWRTDFVYADPPAVAELGEVTLCFEKRERHRGRKARRYSIGGAGLQGKSGTWWSDARTGLLLEYELPLGDEPGYDDVRLVLDATRELTAAEWEAFKRLAVGER
jgi:hypothetical protein